MFHNKVPIIDVNSTWHLCSQLVPLTQYWKRAWSHLQKFPCVVSAVFIWDRRILFSFTNYYIIDHVKVVIDHVKVVDSFQNHVTIGTRLPHVLKTLNFRNLEHLIGYHSLLPGFASIISLAKLFTQFAMQSSTVAGYHMITWLLHTRLTQCLQDFAAATRPFSPIFCM